MTVMPGMVKAFSYLRKRFGYERSVYGIIAPHVNGGNALSIGCGEGKIERLLEKSSGARIEGVEVTDYREKRIRTTLFDGKRLPFRRNSFDTSMFIYSLHHSTNIEQLVAEAARVTRKWVLILDHTYTNGVSRALLKAYDWTVNFPYRMPIPFNFLMIPEWKGVFERHGLRIGESSIPSSMNVFFKLGVATSS